MPSPGNRSGPRRWAFESPSGPFCMSGGTYAHDPCFPHYPGRHAETGCNCEKCTEPRERMTKSKDDRRPRTCMVCGQAFRVGRGITVAVMFEDKDDIRSATCGSVVCAIQWFLGGIGFTEEGARPLLKLALRYLQEAARNARHED